MMNDTDRQLLAALHACNQRGGRMLSVVDLLAAGSLDEHVAAYLIAVMRRGASLLVGASPGAAGKTTVMCALLNFAPQGMNIVVVDHPAVFRALPAPPACLLAHEISPAPYYAYIWGETARRFFRATHDGYHIASNLHADTLEETYDQLCGLNGVQPADLRAIELKVFLRMRGGRRWVETVYEGASGDDRLVWRRNGETFERTSTSALIDTATEQRMRELIKRLRASDARTLDEVRSVLSNGEGASQVGQTTRAL